MPKFLRETEMKYPYKNARWKTKFAIYECECGTEYEAVMAQVKSGTQYQHCSMCSDKIRKKKLSLSKTRHGEKGSKLYQVYYSIIFRTENIKCDQYDDYGGRGIKMCPEWRNDNKAFFTWAKDNGYIDGLTIERKNNNIGYSPDNCIWADRYVQAQNQRRKKRDLPTGATWHGRKTKRIRVQITSNGKRYSLGVFKTKKEAANAYNDFCIKNNTNHTQNKINEW